MVVELIDVHDRRHRMKQCAQIFQTGFQYAAAGVEYRECAPDHIQHMCRIRSRQRGQLHSLLNAGMEDDTRRSRPAGIDEVCGFRNINVLVHAAL